MLKTFSSFYYGHTITKNNKFLNFNEGAGELSAELAVKGYTLTEFAIEVARAMNEIGNVNEYTTSLDRVTGKITIISDNANFDLLINTGAQSALSCFSLAGFNGADLTGALSYESDSFSGFEFEPQFKLQSFVDFEDNEEVANSSVSENANGDVIEVVNFGEVNVMECDVRFQTNTVPQGPSIKDDPSGEDNFRAFLKYISTKAPIEFIPDFGDKNTFTKCILNRNKKNRNGLGFKLIEMERARGYFESGKMEFRQIK